MYNDDVVVIDLFCFVLLCASGHPVLRTALAVEELGGGQDSRPHDGPRRWHLLRSGEETKEEIAARLSGGQFETSQLVGVPLLFLRDARTHQRRR